MKTIIAILLFVAIAVPATATVLVSEDFESRDPGTLLASFSPDWYATTFAWKVDNQPGMAASGSNYLRAPSRFGTGELLRLGWYDASSGFNLRPAGENLVVASVKMYVPNVVESTFGGMWMFDQALGTIARIGVDMMTGQTLSSATDGVHNIAAKMGAYNDIQLIANFETGLVGYYFNGVDIGTATMTASSLASGFSDFDFYNNGFNANSSVAFLYDDYKIEVAPVPEPSTFFLIGAGLGGFVIYRRRANKVA